METEPRKRHMYMGHNGFAGSLWFAGWLFFLAFTQPIWWKALLGLFVWPFYLGVALR